MVNSIVRSGDQDPKYAISYLERKFPVRWSRAMPSTHVTLDLGSMLEKIHTRIREFKDPREARRALAAPGVQVLDVEGRALPHDPRPPRPVRQPVRPVTRQPVTVVPPALTDEPELFDGEHDVEQID